MDELPNLKTVCCAADIKEVIEISKFFLDHIAFEDSELIGAEYMDTVSESGSLDKIKNMLRNRAETGIS